jgi:hypothetical protein
MGLVERVAGSLQAYSGLDKARSRPAEDLAGRSLLDGITLDYGPPDLLGSFFLKADAVARDLGVSLSFGTAQDLVRINKQNSDTWRPLLPIFDPVHGALNDTNIVAIIGRNSSGDVVATQAARLYNWSNTNFAAEAASLRLFYPNPQLQKLANERIEITTPAADSIAGRVCFSGGVWFHPDYRGRLLTAVLPRISRAYAFTRWFTDVTVTIMAEKLAECGVAARCGYTEINWDLTLQETRTGTVRCALLSMRTEEMLQDLSTFVEQLGPQIDRRVNDRAVQQPHAPARASRG